MALEIQYDKKEDIPEAHVDLFTEKEDKWHLTGITGLVTTADVDNLNKALGLERTEHKATKAKMKVWGDMDQAKVVTDLAELDELRAYKTAAEEDHKDEATKLEAKVDAIVKARTATIEATSAKQIGDLQTANGEQAERIVDFELKDTNRTIGDSLRSASLESKVIDTAVADILILGERMFEITEEGLVLTKDGVGVTPGIAPDVWLSEMQEKRPHWWPTAEGGGAKGGKGGGAGFANNPWTFQHWNLTHQATAMREDRDKAGRMAVAAGTTIGGIKPAAPK